MSERNNALLRKVGDVIAAEPHRYDQAEWFNDENECGTTACVAGWAVLLHDGDVPRDPHGYVHEHRIDELAQDYLGLDDYTAEELFGGLWHPAGYRPFYSRRRQARLVRDALYRLADGASICEVTA